MKPPEQMTHEELQVEIGKEHGWTLRRYEDGEYALINPAGNGVASDWDPSTTLESFAYKLPDYPSDSDALVEASAAFTATDDHLFQVHLFDVFARTHGYGFRDGAEVLVHATAKERAIAFVKTIRERHAQAE
jgi:hypothetical protein